MPSILLALAGGPAGADKRASIEYYRAGKAYFEAGDYRRAVASFHQAYSEHPAKEYLFNIAQAYRKLGECLPALEYYRRYIDTDPGDRGRQIAEKHLAELKTECGDVLKSPGAGTETGTETGTGTGTGTETGTETGTGAEKSGPVSDAGASVSATPSPDTTPAVVRRATETEEAPRAVVSAAAGPALHDIGEVVVPAVVAARIGAAYPLALGPWNVELGVSLALSPIAWEHIGEGTTVLVTGLLEAGAVRSIAPGWRLRARVGLGDLVAAGLGEGNPFTDEAAASGALHMATGRLELGLERVVARDLAVQLSPALSVSLAHARLAPDIDTITRLSILGGLTYYAR